MKRLAWARVGVASALAWLVLVATATQDHVPLSAHINAGGPLGMVAETGGSVTLTIPLSPIADHLVLVPPAIVAAATGFSATVTAEDHSSQAATDYHDTVHFSSSDPLAVLPADYTFVPGPAGDQGHRQFGFTLKGGGSQTITATDRSMPSIGGTATVVVTPIPTSLAVIVSTPVQYSDRALIGAKIAPSSMLGLTPTGTVTFRLDGSPLSTVPLSSAGDAYSMPAITSAPGGHVVTASFSSSSPNFLGSGGSATLAVTPEDARVSYIGPTFVNTPCAGCTTATVMLSTVVKDISAVPGDPAFDSSAGDVRHATVTFINRTNAAVLCSAPVVLIDSANSQVGTAECNWTVNIGTSLSQTAQVGTVVGGYYVRNDTEDDQLVTISQPVPTSFIVGGGYLRLANPGGSCQAAIGSKANFGFIAHYGSTATLGEAVLILHSSVSCTTGKTGPRVYLVRGSHVTSLGVNQNRAILYIRVSIVDVTKPATPITLDSSGTLKLDMVDNGNPGTLDLLGVTVSKSSGALWFASDWNGSATVKDNLAEGNLVVR